MGRKVLSASGWLLQESATRDISDLMDWFAEPLDVVLWGGPKFRYPFNRASFFEDIHWGEMLSYSLFDANGDFVAFGQLYDRDQHIHLARLIVIPCCRGQGVGKRLIEMLMRAGRLAMPYRQYSLFVFRRNTPAIECYRSLGFEIRDYPSDMPHADVCYYLTKSD